uniref:Uncharacterized protein n=1 Tax=Rhodopseudomonas palustris (strain DX-1) TaxID=652103 RepID=E6VFL6_RHOPX
MIQIPLSQIPSAEEFEAAVEAYRAALEAHRSGPPGVPQPRTAELVEAVIGREPDDHPVVAQRAPDRIVVLPYEIVDDRPLPPEVPVMPLEQRKAALMMELQRAAQDAAAAVLSPARARLLSFDATEAMSVPEEARTPAQVAAIDAWSGFNSAMHDIRRRTTEIEVVIEDLTEASIGGFSLPQF